jgi:hypothetical protein
VASPPPLPPPPPDPTAEIVERIKAAVIPLALQRLDGVNRDHGGVGTNAIGVAAVDGAVGATAVLLADAHHFPAFWWIPILGFGFSAFVAPLSLGTGSFTRRLLRHLPVGEKMSKRLEQGLSPDTGPDIQDLIRAVQRGGDLVAYGVILASLDDSLNRTSAALDLRSMLVSVALGLLAVDVGLSWVFFIVL